MACTRRWCALPGEVLHEETLHEEMLLRRRLMTVEFDSSRTLTGACNGSVSPCRWLGLAGPFGPESEQVGGRAVPVYELHFTKFWELWTCTLQGLQGDGVAVLELAGSISASDIVHVVSRALLHRG